MCSRCSGQVGVLSALGGRHAAVRQWVAPFRAGGGTGVVALETLHHVTGTGALRLTNSPPPSSRRGVHTGTEGAARREPAPRPGAPVDPHGAGLAATDCPRSSPACHGPVRCRPDFGSSPQKETAHSNSPPSPTIKSGNGTLTSPITSLTFDFNSNLAVEISLPFTTPRRGLLDSLAAKRDPSLFAMDIDPDSAEQLAGEGVTEGLGEYAADGGSHDGGDAMDVDDGSPLGRLKPTSTLYQTKLSVSRAHIPAPHGSDAMHDVERPAGSKRRISSLNHSLTPKVSGRNPFGRALTSHWSQRRLTSFVRESNKSKARTAPTYISALTAPDLPFCTQPTPVFPSHQDQPMAMTPSWPKRDCALLPADTPTMPRPPSVANGNPSSSAPGDESNVAHPSGAAAGHHGTSPSGAAPPSKFRRTQSMNSNVFSSQHRVQPPIRHCNSLPALPTDYPEAGTVLPSIETGKDALKRISPSTVSELLLVSLNQFKKFLSAAKLLDGQYKGKYDECYVIDCRFPYEYAGGHIPTAVNVNTMDALEQMFVTKPITGNRVLLVFHCEFSSQRAPRM
ncbi:MAG: hypothetical protein BJ554DRAFT_8010 [Olpidium bornovanus]|uniref:Rhodanese domain-containing protein n=1 Tax=Olpidium bornovanus TaxID=278681 RepID=A0A8H8A1W9_9FUNG|nr:MAG: hypothetical protein BJ554DRAFT_8010 [Olpidium bornovanus]